MIGRIAFCLALFAAAWSAPVRAADVPAAVPVAPDDRHVLIVTMDGFPSYVFRDPHAPIPTIRRLAAEGVAAEGMRVCNPSVTWPNHTTLVTGVTPAKHSVLFNGLLMHDNSGKPFRVDPARDQRELISVPTLWDTAHAAGLTTAAINWPASRNSPTLDASFPDCPNPFDHMSPTMRGELIEAGIVPANKFQFGHLSPPQQDQMWTSTACYLIRRHQPNLLVLHLLLTDTVNHQYGPQTTAAYTALALADYELRDVLDALDDAGIREKTTIFLTTDHGFARYTRLMQPNVLLAKAGIRSDQAQIITEGGTAFVYVMDPGVAGAVEALFRGKEGIADIIKPDGFAGLGLPTPDKNARMCNLLLAAKDGYSFGTGAYGTYIVDTSRSYAVGGHGYLSSNPHMLSTFVVAGRGIKRGAKLGIIDNTSVAPTAARLLGHTIPGADGRVLTEVLAEGSTLVAAQHVP